jgi:hypothetical protein
MNRRVVAALAAILVAYLVLGGVYAFVTPIFEKPDEDWHFAYGMYLASTGRLPVQTLEAPQHLAKQEGSQPPLYYGLLAGIIRVIGPARVSRGYAALSEHNPHTGWVGPIAWDNRNVIVHGRCERDCRWTALAAYLGRMLSLLLGVGTLVATAYVLHQVFPEHPILMLTAAAAIALNPQFLHIASSVSNDALATSLASASFAAGFWYLRHPEDRRRMLLLGLLSGLTVLSKLSACSAVAITALVILLVSPLRWRQRLEQLAGWGVTTLVVCGWWFARNYLLYGDLTATRIHLVLFGAQPSPLTWERFVSEWVITANSFWAYFGWGGIVFPWSAAYTLVRVIAVVLFVSFLILVMRKWHHWTHIQQAFVSLTVLDVLLVGGLQEQWMRHVLAPYGRLLFPAMLPIASILALGLLGNVPLRFHRPIAATWSIAWGIVPILAVFLVILPSTRPPEPLLDSVSGPVLATWANGSIELRDVAWFEDEHDYYVQFVWRVNARLDQNWSIFIHGLDESGNLVAQRDSHPGLGNRPTTTWEPGQTFADVYALPRSGAPIRSLAIGFYLNQGGSWIRLPVSSDQFQVSADALAVPLDAVRRASRLAR